MNTLTVWFGRRGAAAAFLAAGFLGVLAPSGPAAAAGKERPGLEASRAFIEKLADAAVDTWGKVHPGEAERLAAMETLIRAGFDVDFIVRGVLGRAWRKLDPSDRQAFAERFYDFFAEVYLPNLSRFARDDLRVVGARPRGRRDVAVRTQVRSFSGEWVEVDWRVRATGKGLRVIDIVVAGVSLLLVQREEFESVIARRGFQALMRELGVRIDRAMAAR